MATTVVEELTSPVPSVYLPTWRPWMALYSVRLKPRGYREDGEQPPAPIQLLLPEEMLAAVFERLPVGSLGAVQCVCRQWRRVGATPDLWRAACADAFRTTPPEANLRMLRSQYRHCWKTMFLDRPHLRFDGLYVSRNTYIKRGIVEWRVKNACHLVCYFRYVRFLPDGRLLYRTSPETVARVARRMLEGPGRRRRKDDMVYDGRYRIEGDKVLTKFVYPNANSTEIRSRLTLRSTVRGANNRLDMLSIVSYDRVDGTASSLAGTAREDDEDEDISQQSGVQALNHKRGMAPYVFVPWHDVATSPLNLPVEQMDVYIPG